MARIIVNGTIVKYPLGGMILWHLSWLKGLMSQGHEVYFVEKCEYEYGCYDVGRRSMSNDPTYGLAVIKKVLLEYGMEDKWCFVDIRKQYWGLDKIAIEEVFKTADLFIEMEWGEWEEESQVVPKRIFIDGEPGWFQIKLEKMQEAKMAIPHFDHYLTTGQNIGFPTTQSPDVGIEWDIIMPPVLVDVFDDIEVNTAIDAPFTTIMNWRSNKILNHKGITYGQKGEAFETFIRLPELTEAPMEIAVSGKNVPRERLLSHKWKVKHADDIASSIDSYLRYIAASFGEFTVAKQFHSQLWTGWTGDRMAYYLQLGKPVVQQDTGFSAHLPTGLGLIAVKTPEEAADAINRLKKDYHLHSKAAKEIAHEYFDAKKLMKKLLSNYGF